MTGNEIRKKYIEYFRKNNHKVIGSSSLVPSDDPTLLFTNAGMVQFKRTFLGEKINSYNQATSCQKCVRAGGKHNDLENVGRTARHHTFFEMLGNFSFGNYFKQEAIEFAWDVVTNVFKLSVDDLWISTHLDDEESFELWQHKIGISPDRIVRLGNKENFWSMGEIGPCGPCSEIFVDRGHNFSCSSADCNIGCNCDRFVEIWNLVFMQFNREKSGKMSTLPKPSIDTGLGLERLASVIQNVKSNFETDLIFPIIKEIEILSETRFGEDKNQDMAMKVIADHSRAAAFLISDGVLPLKEGRGYVLRRILRRAIRYGRALNMNKPFLSSTIETVTKIMKEAYPELKSSLGYINSVVTNEEIRFSETIDTGLKIINEKLLEIRQSGGKVSGDLIFKLHDTYGFPVDLVCDIAKDKGILLDLDGFHNKMEIQRKQSYLKRSFDNISESAYKKISLDNCLPKFTGYDHLANKSNVLLIVLEGVEVLEAIEGSEIDLVTEKTPFYSESGGQTGDKGIISADKLKILVKNTVKNSLGIIVHKGTILSGKIEVGQTVSLMVNKYQRVNTSRNHTTTHILHEVLRQEFGTHIKQAGSLVSADKLRFDFTHFSKISRKKLLNIENSVNDQITNNLRVLTLELSMKEAVKSGAIALFGEKYGEYVRVVKIGTLSKELCGGTHVKHTGNIGMFTIISESSIASGVRRIEAVTGDYTLKYVHELREVIEATSAELKTRPDNILKKVSNIQASNRLLEKKVEQLVSENAILKIKIPDEFNPNKPGRYASSSEVHIVNSIKVRIGKVKIDTVGSLRKMVDHFKDEIKSGIVILGSEKNGKAMIIVGVTKDLTEKFSANLLVKKIAKLVNGNGGGRSDMAQAGGTKPQNIDLALKKAISIIRNI